MLMKNKKYQDYYNKANKELLNNNYDNAIEYYKKLLELKENDLICLNELGNLYKNINRFNDAIICYEKIVNIETDLCKKCVILNEIGTCFNIMENYVKAIEYFEKILQINNNVYEVYNNISCSYFKMKNFTLCESNCYKSLRIKMNNTALYQLADLYFFTKKYEVAVKFYEKIDGYHNNNKIKYNCSFPYLAQKKFIEGFKLYENRLEFNNLCSQMKQKQRVEIPQIKDWTGIEPCNNLLVIYEQGIGDNIQYYRFLIELSELHPNMKIYYFCKDFIQHIFKEYDNIHIIQNVNFNDYDFKIYIMSLPYILKINEIKPNVINYIYVNNNKLEYWKRELSKLKKYKVGITYNGLLSSVIDKNIPLTEFNVLFNDGIDLICIHKLDEINNEHKEMFKDKIHFFDIDKDIAFEDTIAILHNIDLLITVDTFIVHLSGILNVKTWLLLGFISDWRWFDDDICHWYKSVELIRMKKNEELKSILSDVKDKLLFHNNNN
jgi:tetratricopeptide (TPR) repeat protein